MRLFDFLRRSRKDLEDEDARDLVHDIDATRICDAVPRTRVRVSGEVHAMTYPAHGASPACSARLEDGTGSILLVFLGRTDVPGVDAGRRLIAEGMLTEVEGQPAIYNPKLELLTGAS